MHKFVLTITSLATLCSIGYFSLIAFDMSVMVSKNWRHDQLLLLQTSTVVSAISLLVATSLVSYFLKSNSKSVIFGLNFTLLLAWLFLLIFGMIGIIN